MSPDSATEPCLTSRPIAPSVPCVETLSEVATRNLAVAMSLRSTAWKLAEAGLRTFRPELSEAEVQAEVRAQFRRTTG